MNDSGDYAPGAPGLPPRWTSSAKSAVGTALGPGSRVWFTLSHGIFNEVYYPRIDQACLRDLGLLITDGRAFFSEEKRDAISRLEWVEPGIPAYRVTNTCRSGRYRVTKQILCDPSRDVVLQHTRIEALNGRLEDYQVYALLAPHLANGGWHNSAWVGDYKGVPMLFAQRQDICMAVACSPDWTRGSAGFVGASDGWQDVSTHKTMTWNYRRAEDGNVALIGQADAVSGQGTFVLALAFGSSAAEAGHHARASLLEGFEPALDAFTHHWRAWHKHVGSPLWSRGSSERAGRTSVAILKCHEEKHLPGAMIASLSIPWGNSKSDDDLGGYHLVWPRDLVESAGALLAAGAHVDARRILDYLRVTQSADGSWPQNMWVSGESYWHGVQLDETAFPILLVDLMRRHAHLDREEAKSFWPMIRDASRFLVANGPASPQDRWEENAGLSPFTTAVEIAALLAAADAADAAGHADMARYLQETADCWNELIDAVLYVQATALARQVGVDGYYVRIASADIAEASSPAGGFVPIKNRPWPSPDVPASEIVSPDALALVRFGLRAADDPRVVNTIRVIDAVLKIDLPQGPGWRRYTRDGYGEHEDGHPFDGVGIGRVWPLLTGERAHYELAAGRRIEAERLLATLEACASEGGLLPEQTWDGPDIPSRELLFGRPAGSAMPLAWAHAEHLKLARSLRDGRVFDLPPQTVQRYVTDRVRSRLQVWRAERPIRQCRAGHTLRVETATPAITRWSVDGWATAHDQASLDTGLGVHITDLPVAAYTAGTVVSFALRVSSERPAVQTDGIVTIVPDVS